MDGTSKNESFHQRLALLIGTEEPFRWAKRMGIPSSTFARIWNNFDIPKYEHLCRIAQRCNVSLDWLLLEKGAADCSDVAFTSVPLIGLANCGIAQGWYNESDLTTRILLPSFMADDGAFAVLCRGKSMIPAGIKDGNVCVVSPNQPVESGKPALIRTKSFIKGREISLVTVKIFVSQDEDSISLSGWLDPDEAGEQSLFTEKRLKNCITMIAPVRNVLSVRIPDSITESVSPLNKAVLLECLETLSTVREQVTSENFADLILFLYEEILKNGRPTMQTIRGLMEKITKKV